MRRDSGRLIAAIPALAGILISCTPEAPAAPGATSICTWKDDKKAVITITIDDNCWKDVAFVTSVANPKGIKITWALITGQVDSNPDFFGTWENWKTIPAMGIGHELASHGVIVGTVLDLKTDEEIRANYRDSKLAIERNVPGNGRCLSIIYHYDYPKDQYFSLMPEYYIVGRGMNGGLNDASPSRDLLADCGMWRLCTHDRTGAAIDQAISQGKWYMWFSHEINDKAGNVPTSVFSAFCDYAYSKRDLLWFAAMREAAQYIHERDASVARVVSVTASRIELSLTHTLSTAVCDFNYPLTLKTEVPDEWSGVYVSQGGGVKAATVSAASGKRYALYDARPNCGPVTLNDGSLTGAPAISAQSASSAPFRSHRTITASRLRQLCGKEGRRIYDASGHAVDPRAIPGGIYITGNPGPMRAIIVLP